MTYERHGDYEIWAWGDGNGECGVWKYPGAQDEVPPIILLPTIEAARIWVSKQRAPAQPSADVPELQSDPGAEADWKHDNERGDLNMDMARFMDTSVPDAGGADVLNVPSDYMDGFDYAVAMIETQFIGNFAPDHTVWHHFKALDQWKREALADLAAANAENDRLRAALDHAEAMYASLAVELAKQAQQADGKG